MAPLLHGLKALGDLVTLTLSTREPLPQRTAAGVGWLPLTVAGAMDKSWRIRGLAERALNFRP